MYNLPQRFKDKVTIDENGCWIWTAFTCPRGYGRFSFQAKKYLAHRFAYEALVGPIPSGKVIDHYRINQGPRNAPCSTSCCNPEHLEVVTQKKNVRRGIAGNPGRKKKESPTHCKQGHKYDEENSYRYIRPSGVPNIKCRACDRARKKKQ